MSGIIMTTQKERVRAKTETVLTLHNFGWNRSQISAALHMDKKTVKRILTAHGVTFEDFRWKDETIDRMLDLRSQGLTQKEIGEAIGISRSSVAQKLRELLYAGHDLAKPKRYEGGAEPACTVGGCPGPALVYRGSPLCGHHLEAALAQRMVAKVA